MFKKIILFCLLMSGSSFAASTKSISYQEAGLATLKAVTSLGGKQCAIWLLGTNPATATVLIVGLGAGMAAGYGFDAVKAYVLAQPADKFLENQQEILEDDFVLVEDDKNPENYFDYHVPTFIERNTIYLGQVYNTAVDSISNAVVSIPGAINNAIENLPTTLACVASGAAVSTVVGVVIPGEVVRTVFGSFAGSIGGQSWKILGENDSEVSEISSKLNSNNANLDLAPPAVIIYDLTPHIIEDYSGEQA